MKFVESKLITFLEAKEILNKNNNDSEFGYEQKITLEYLRRLSMLSKKDLKNIKKELEELEFLKDYQIIMLINLIPKDEEEVKTIFMKERTNLDDDQIKKILGILNKYRPKSKINIKKKK